MRYSLVAGENTEISFDFDGATIDHAPGYPTVTVLDDYDNEISTFPATLTGSNWVSIITIPNVDNDDTLIYGARWDSIDLDNNKITVTIPIILSPNVSSRTGDQVLLPTTTLKFVMDGVIDHTSVEIRCFQFNEEMFRATGNSHIQMFDTTEITVTIPEIEPSLSPYLITVNSVLIFNLWIVTPQILRATLAVESWINKARISQTVPQLEYTQSDILSYLERGLNLFNSYMPQLTAFTGTNMRGILYEMWLLCSTYYALGAQLQAEGAMAFDFSGQATSLSVDRTQSIESALGRIESMMGDRIPAAKRLLVKYGIQGGDGSEGDLTSRNTSSLGRLTISSGASMVGSAYASGRILGYVRR